MTLNGIDIASWQAGLQIKKMTTTNFVIVKATEATDYINPYFDGWASDTVAQGKKLGCYHFARPGDAIKQADYFLAKTKKYWGKAIMFLDWEDNAIDLGPGWAKTWCDRVYAKTGTKPMIYMSKSVCNAYNWSACKNAGYELWVAQYPDYNETGYKKIDDIWTDGAAFGAWGRIWTIFQYASTGRIKGYDGRLDINCFRYDAKKWDESASGSAIKQAISKVTTTAPVTTEKPKWKKMVDKAVQICKDDTHGYSQYYRWGPDYDCSSLMYFCADYAGYGVSMEDPRWTGSMAEDFTACGFKRIKFSKSALVAGDIVYSHNSSRQHTELYIGNGQTAGAHIAETGDIHGSAGDQTGNEISVQNLCWTPDWILRPPDSGAAVPEDKPAAGSVKYKVTASPNLNVRTKRSTKTGKVVGSLKNGSTVYLSDVKTNSSGNTWAKVASGKYKGRFVAVKFGGKTLAKKVIGKTIEQLAQEVIEGKWGNGSTRKQKLEAAGYDYNAVQNRVNELMM